MKISSLNMQSIAYYTDSQAGNESGTNNYIDNLGHF